MKRSFCFKLKALDVEWLSLCVASSADPVSSSQGAEDRPRALFRLSEQADALQTRRLTAFRPAQDQAIARINGVEKCRG